MEKRHSSRSGFFGPRIMLSLAFCSAGIFLALLGSGLFAAAEEQQTPPENSGIQFGQSYHNDVSPALSDLALIWPPQENKERELREANLNPKIPNDHIDNADPVVQNSFYLRDLEPNIPGTTLNFDGIPFPGVVCNCAPPDTNGAVGLTQYVQIVNEGYQVFNKTTGASVLGPTAISSITSSFGGVCETAGHGAPVVAQD